MIPVVSLPKLCLATYWVKMLSDIEVLAQPDDNFWMKTAYTIPNTPHANVTPGQTGVKMVPINRMVPRSFITNIKAGASVRAGSPTLARGIAFGGDTGVAKIDFSADGGKTWQPAKLGKDEGKYGFRQCHAAFRVRPWRIPPTVLRGPVRPCEFLLGPRYASARQHGHMVSLHIPVVYFKDVIRVAEPAQVLPALLGIGAVLAVPASVIGVRLAARHGLVRLTQVTSWIMAICALYPSQRCIRSFCGAGSHDAGHHDPRPSSMARCVRPSTAASLLSPEDSC